MTRHPTTSSPTLGAAASSCATHQPSNEKGEGREAAGAATQTIASTSTTTTSTGTGRKHYIASLGAARLSYSSGGVTTRRKKKLGGVEGGEEGQLHQRKKDPAASCHHHYCLRKREEEEKARKEKEKQATAPKPTNNVVGTKRKNMADTARRNDLRGFAIVAQEALRWAGALPSSVSFFTQYYLFIYYLSFIISFLEPRALFVDRQGRAPLCGPRATR